MRAQVHENRGHPRHDPINCMPVDPQRRIVNRQPMTELWRADGFTTSQRGADLSSPELAAMLAAGPLRFVIANVGDALEWLAPGERFEFWKGEVKSHLAEPESPARLEEFSGEYCYFASLWQGDVLPIVLLEKYH